MSLITGSVSFTSECKPSMVNVVLQKRYRDITKREKSYTKKIRIF